MVSFRRILLKAIAKEVATTLHDFLAKLTLNVALASGSDEVRVGYDQQSKELSIVYMKDGEGRFKIVMGPVEGGFVERLKKEIAKFK